MTQIPQLPPHIDVQDDDLLVVRQSDNKDHKVPVAALSKGNVRYVQTIDDLRSVNGMQDGQATEIVSTGRSGLFRWQAGDLSDECAADPMMGIYVPPVGQSGAQGAWVRVPPSTDTQLEWFYTEDWDDAIDGAAAWLDKFGGGTLRLPQTQDVYIYRPHIFKSAILVEGHRRGTRTSDIGTGVVFVADGVECFRWGTLGDPSTRMVGGGCRNVVARGIGYKRGNVTALYGSTNPTFGYSTVTTSLGGAVNATTGENMTNVFAVCGYAFIPFIFEGNQVEGFGYGFRNVASTYNIYAEKNDIFDCGVAVYMGAPGVPTTMGIRKNKIERCAIGVYLNYPTQMVQIIDNVIEANYGGCDILMYNTSHTIEIERNYFEGTTQCIEVHGDSAGYEPHLLRIAKNTGVKFHCRFNLVNTVFEDNWMDRVELAPRVGGYVRNIVFRNNFTGASRNPFTPTSENFILNSAARPHRHQIRFNNDYATPAGIPIIDGTAGLAVNQYDQVFHVATGQTSANSFVVEIPNTDLSAFVRVTLMKYANAGQGYTYGTRYAEYLLGIRRVAGEDVRFQFDKINEVAFNIGDNDVGELPVPSMTLAGGAGEAQTLTAVIAGGILGGLTGNNLIRTEFMNSASGLVIRNA